MSIAFISKSEADEQRAKIARKQQAAKERAIAKQRAKQADPAYRERQLEKSRQAQQRARDRQNTPEARQKRLEAAQQSQERARQRQIEKTKTVPLKNFKTATSKPKASKGLKGRTPTAEEKRLMDLIGALPCVACRKMGVINYVISLHHTDGRTKPYAHAKSLPLCAPHHDTPLTPEEREIHGDAYPVHAKGSYGGKKAFESAYGTQEELLSEVYQELGIEPPWLGLDLPNI